MKRRYLKTRVAMRCTVSEKKNLLLLAELLDVSLSDLMRESITIAYSRAQTPNKWRQDHQRAIKATPEEYRWTT